MGTAENKRLVEKVDASKTLKERFSYWADDAVWTNPGTTRWSGTYRGKTEIIEKLLKPVFAELGELGTFTVDRVVAEGDYVVQLAHVEGRKTKKGIPYSNTYCNVYRIVDGKIQELIEFCDTELITAAFGK